MCTQFERILTFLWQKRYFVNNKEENLLFEKNFKNSIDKRVSLMYNIWAAELGQ